MPVAATEKPASRGERFLHSVLWAWTGVAVSIFSGFFLARYIVHRVGHDAAGIWALIFSVLESVWMMDLGFRAAVQKYTAHYHALGEPEKVNETLNTGLAFSCAGCSAAVLAALFFARAITRFENVPPEFADVFAKLLMMVGVVWALGALFNLLSATLEGFQRFDLTSRIWIVQLTLRAFGILGVLATGHGLLAMGKIVLAAMLASYTLTFFALRRVFPQFRISPRLVTYRMFRQMLGFGLHTFGATAGLQTLTQGAPILIGHFTPSPAFVAYFTYPQRLFLYSADMVGRVGLISSSHAAELAARNDYPSIARMGIFINRYCFTLFAPLTIAVLVYGRQIFSLWIDPKFAAECASILPVMALGITLATVAQFNSSSILYGLGKHHGYAYSMMIEAALFLTGLWWAIPRYGIFGAACVSSGLLVLNRGIVLSILICRALRYSFWKYLGGIYTQPIAAAIPVLIFAAWMKNHAIPGATWLQLIEASTAIATLYFAIAYFVCLDPSHRSMPVNFVRTRLRRAAA